MLTNESKPDEFLLAELQNGQERAFDFIFRKYYKALCALANVYIHDIDKAQSLVQNCFIKLWKNRERPGEIMHISSYLSSMVRNQCIDYLRSLKSTGDLNENLENNKIISDSENLMIAREFEEKLVSALSSMPARTRIAFEYSRFDNLTYKEIAEKMNISVKAVEALVCRALRILRIELKDYLPIIESIPKSQSRRF